MSRSLAVMLLCLLPIFACMNTATAQCPAATSLVFNTVITSESRCAASGTATVSVSGGATPYTYSIIAGPVLAPPQSSNVLQSLEPGVYTVSVTDNCNTSVTGNFTITGTYAVPSPILTSQAPSCSGSSDGSITVNVTDGRAPFTYSLISPSPIITGPQASNVFTGLPAGTYTCQVADSCGNFQTRTVDLITSPGTIGIGGPTLQYLDCDSFAVYMSFFVSSYRPSYTITATLPDGSVVTHVLTAPVLNVDLIRDTFYTRFQHLAGTANMMSITITDQCGVTSSASFDLANGMDMVSTPLLTGGCSNNYSYAFDAFPFLHCGTVTYTLVDPFGAVVATQTNNSTFSGYPPGIGYQVIRQDCCKTDTLQFDWESAPPFSISWTQNMAYGPCKEGVTSLFIAFSNNGLADVVLVSGPPSVTYADGTVHTYTYPDTTYNVGSGAILGFFGVGTYKLYALDQCGNKDSVTVTFGPSDVRNTTFTASVINGCTDANKILLNVTSNSIYAPGFITVDPVYSQSVPQGDNSFSDSVVNLPAGTYHVTYQYQTEYGAVWMGMPDPGCDVIRDTLIIPPYVQPTFSPAAAIAVCGATRHVALLPDSSSGVLPYAFQAIAGPATTAQQASPVFPGLSAGTYTFLMADGCSNSFSRSVSIDTLAVPAVITSGSTCAGGAATFTLPSSPFYSYTWQYPNGSTSTGNSLTINPITASDLGNYNISVTSSIGGCTNTTSRNYMLDYCIVLPQTLLRFNGQWKGKNLELRWQTADETNLNGYIVERSTDGIVFTPLRQAGATYVPMHVYAVTDMQVPSGVVYYRLKMVLKNGAASYSNIISFQKAHAQPINVYPRLITGNTPVIVTYPVTNSSAFIRVVGIDGRVWRTVPVPPRSTETSIDVANLASGSYVIVFSANGVSVPTQVWRE
jgi:hypothetical protein